MHNTGDTLFHWRLAASVVMGVLLLVTTGCTAEQQQQLSTFVQDLARNVLVALAL